MITPEHSIGFISNACDVFLLFTIPIGGGIPAGVILAKSRGIEWKALLLLYLVSDIALACTFESLMRLIIMAGKRFHFLGRFNEAVKNAMNQTIKKYGVNPSPLSLIWISFGVDPMTGRATALAAGHGYLSGWLLAIAGDMIFFTIIMVSTLWLNNILGDGTWTAVIIMITMIGIPSFIRKIKKDRSTKESSSSDEGL